MGPRRQLACEEGTGLLDLVDWWIGKLLNWWVEDVNLGLECRVNIGQA